VKNRVSGTRVRMGALAVRTLDVSVQTGVIRTLLLAVQTLNLHHFR
jgi:hypothetical protein